MKISLSITQHIPILSQCCCLFYCEVRFSRIEMAKKLKEMNENSDKEGDMLGKAANDGPLVTAIKQRQVAHHNEK